MTSAPEISAARRPTRGASLIELMVGLVVGLLVTLAATSSAQFFTANQRQGIGVGAGQTNAASALAAIRDDVATGGMGFFVNGDMRCRSLNLSVGNTLVSNGAVFAPVQATRVNGNDVLDVVYASEVASGAWSQLELSSDGSTAQPVSQLPVDVVSGSTMLLAPTLDQADTMPCLVRTATASVAATNVTRQAITFGPAGQHNQGVFNTAPVYPKDAAILITGAMQWNRYEVVDGNLTVTRRLANQTATLLRNVVAFRVEYGVAAAGGTTMEDWVETTDAGWTSLTAATAPRVRAVRIGVLVRSAAREKGEAASCDATAVQPRLFGLAIDPGITDWRCYRYRTAEVVAPLRNLVHGTVAITWPEE